MGAATQGGHLQLLNFHVGIMVEAAVAFWALVGAVNVVMYV